MREGPWRITFDTNPDLCNLNCIMCEEHSIYREEKWNKKRMMNPALITQVIEETSRNGLEEVIPSTMGEPLLYPHFDRFLELSDEHDFKINLTTNGTFPDIGVERWGKKLLPRCSDIKISINGSKKKINEQIMRGIEHNKWISDIEKFIELRDGFGNGTTITFQVTYMKSNLDDLENILRLAMERGVDRFKGHQLWITWPELRSESLTEDTETRKKWNQKVDKLRNIADDNIKLDNVEKLSIEDKDNKLPEEYGCPFAGKEAWIAWNGRFNVCCAPDERRREFGDFGNVNERSFIDIWNSEKYQEFVKNAGKTPLCKKCNMRRPEEET